MHTRTLAAKAKTFPTSPPHLIYTPQSPLTLTLSLTLIHAPPNHLYPSPPPPPPPSLLGFTATSEDNRPDSRDPYHDHDLDPDLDPDLDLDLDFSAGSIPPPAILSPAPSASPYSSPARSPGPGHPSPLISPAALGGKPHNDPNPNRRTTDPNPKPNPNPNPNRRVPRPTSIIAYVGP